MCHPFGTQNYYTPHLGLRCAHPGLLCLSPPNLLPLRGCGHRTTIGQFLVFCERFLESQSSSHWHTRGNNNSMQNPDNTFSALTVVPLRGTTFGCMPSPRLKPGLGLSLRLRILFKLRSSVQAKNAGISPRTITFESLVSASKRSNRDRRQAHAPSAKTHSYTEKSLDFLPQMTLFVKPRRAVIFPIYFYCCS